MAYRRLTKVVSVQEFVAVRITAMTRTLTVMSLCKLACGHQIERRCCKDKAPERAHCKVCAAKGASRAG